MSEEDVVSRASNLVSWWTKLANISASAANLVTGVPQGDDLPATHNSLGTVGNMVYDADVRQRTYPGIIRINRVPIWGVTGVGTGVNYSDISYLNRAASQFYWTVNHANSRDRSYDKADLFSCLIALDNILQMVTQCVRVYGVAKRFSSSNKYLGKALVEACGFDYSIVTGNNLAQFLFRLNVCIHQLNKFYIPNMIDMFAEHMNDISRIYCDEPTENAQLMVVNNAGYYTYDDTTGAFTYVSEVDSSEHFVPRTMQYFDVIDSLISDLYNSQYMGIMNADMRKCFGESACVAIPEIPVDYTTDMQYDKEFNLKLRNAQFIGTYDFTNTLGLNPNHVDELQSSFIVNRAAFPDSAFDKVFYFNNDEPADVVNYLLATRYRFSFRGSIASAIITDCGSELLIKIDSAWVTAGNVTWAHGVTTYLNFQATNPVAAMESFSYLETYSKVLPLYALYTVTTTNLTTFYKMRLNDIENVGILETDEYARLNYAAMSSLYELTNISRYSVTSNGPKSIV